MQISVFVQPVEIDGAYRVSIVTITAGSVQPMPKVEVLIGPGGKFKTIDAAYEYIKVAAPLINQLIQGGLEMAKGRKP